MPKFQYIACEVSGQQVAGVLDAPNRGDALSSLASRHLFPTSVIPIQEVDTQRPRIWRRVANRHRVTFFTQLSDLLRAGVPLLRSLDLLERTATNPTLRAVVQEIREQVAEGTRLAEAMRQHPSVFSPLAISMVRAGEEGSFLEDVLMRVAKFTEHNDALKRRVTGAMIYPIFLLTAMLSVVAGMLVFFVPKFQPIFDRLSEQGSLPWATTTLMALSDAAKNYWFVVLIVLGAGCYVLRSWTKSDWGRERIDRTVLRLVGIGPLVRGLAVSRFCRILGTLMSNGVPILRSLEIAKDATGNTVLSRAISSAAENISEGKSLAEPLASCGQFPAEIVEMISVGEEANTLERVLIDIADGTERRTHQLVDTLVRLLEPILLTAMAGLVLFVVVALLWPIMQSSSIL